MVICQADSSACPVSHSGFGTRGKTAKLTIKWMRHSRKDQVDGNPATADGVDGSKGKYDRFKH